MEQELDKKILDLGQDIKDSAEVKNQVIENKIDVLTEDIKTINENINNLQKDMADLQELVKVLVANQLLDKI